MKYFVEYGNDRCASTDSGLKSKGYKSKVNFTNVHSQNLKRQKRIPVEKKICTKNDVENAFKRRGCYF